MLLRVVKWKQFLRISLGFQSRPPVTRVTFMLELETPLTMTNKTFHLEQFCIKNLLKGVDDRRMTILKFCRSFFVDSSTFEDCACILSSIRPFPHSKVSRENRNSANLEAHKMIMRRKYPDLDPIFHQTHGFGCEPSCPRPIIDSFPRYRKFR